MAQKQLSKQQLKQLRKFQGNRTVDKTKYLYWYFLFSGAFMLVYGISAVIITLPIYPIIGPFALVMVYFLMLLIKKNWKLIWMYVKRPDRGRLMMYLNHNSAFSEEHKHRLVRWVYLSRDYIRSEKRSFYMKVVAEGGSLTKKEKRLMRKKIAFCPQQLLDGFNRAILINALIYAHVNISLLDQEVRDKLDLTDEHMASFRIKDEIERCKTK